MKALIAEGREVSEAEYAASCRHQSQLKQDVQHCFEAVDVLICPATPGPAPDPTTTGDSVMNVPWSYTGLLTISLPVALSSEDLPMAIQLVGPASDESALFRVAAWFEDVILSDNDRG